MPTSMTVLVCGWCMITATVQGTTFKPWLKEILLQGYDFGTDITFMTKAINSVSCVMECMWQKESCLSVSFDSVTKKCVGYNTRFANTSGGSANGNTVYYSSVGCEDPPAVNNVSATAGSNSYGSVRMYECDPGYNISGDASTTCLWGAIWSPVNFTCISACGKPPFVQRTVVTQVRSVYYYSCDYGYVQTGSITSTSCQPDGQYSALDIACNDCTTYDTSYSFKPNKLFDPPGFTASYSGSSVDVIYCKTECETRLDMDCAAVYYRSSTNYCALQEKRVHDELSYAQYYETDVTFNEYIRNCLN